MVMSYCSNSIHVMDFTYSFAFPDSHARLFLDSRPRRKCIRHMRMGVSENTDCAAEMMPERMSHVTPDGTPKLSFTWSDTATLQNFEIFPVGYAVSMLSSLDYGAIAFSFPFDSTTRPRYLITCIRGCFFSLSHRDSTSCLYFLPLLVTVLSDGKHTGH